MKILDAEAEAALRAIVIDWIGEGFTTPPFSDAQYDVFESLGLTNDDLYHANIERPQLPPGMEIGDEVPQ